MSNGSSTERVLADLRRHAAAGRPGDLLPSTRELVARLGVGPVTVSRAVARLAAEGVLVSEPGRGTFVAPPRPGAPPSRPTPAGRRSRWPTARSARTSCSSCWRRREPGDTVLATGYLDAELQPTRLLADALARAARRPGAWSRPPLSGVPELRAALAGLSGVDPADVLVVPGGQAGLSTALRALAPPGSAVVVESPTYLGVLILARSAGLRPVPVPVDADGLRPDLLAEALDRSGARLVYCQPSYANPTGSVMPPDRRAAVLAAVRDAGAFLIEDDYARLLGIAGDPPPPLVLDDPHGHVVHLTSLTKPTAPSMRVGALVARGPVAARLRTLRVVDDFFVPVPLQEAAVELLAAAGWRRHLTGLRRALGAAGTRCWPGWPGTRRSCACRGCRTAGCTCGPGCRTGSATSRWPTGAAGAGCGSAPARRTSPATRPPPTSGCRSPRSRRSGWSPAPGCSATCWTS